MSHMNFKIQDDQIIEGVKIILFELGNLSIDERLCIICDHNTAEVGRIFDKIAKDNHVHSTYFEIAAINAHGEEPPEDITMHMTKSNLVVGLTRYSLAHSEARRRANMLGVRYLSLPFYSKDILMHESLRADFQRLGKKAEEMANRFTNSKKIKIITRSGTNIDLDTSGRVGNFAPGYVNNDILLGSPPDIEANIAPNEGKSNGVIVIDGSVTTSEIGLLHDPIVLSIENGRISHIKGDERHVDFLNELFYKFGTKSRILAELGIGFNNRAKLCGNMLVDEGCYGTIHFGFGSNSTIGGQNKIGFHLDFVFFADEVIIDNEQIKL